MWRCFFFIHVSISYIIAFAPKAVHGSFSRSSASVSHPCSCHDAYRDQALKRHGYYIDDVGYVTLNVTFAKDFLDARKTKQEARLQVIRAEQKEADSEKTSQGILRLCIAFTLCVVMACVLSIVSILYWRTLTEERLKETELRAEHHRNKLLEAENLYLRDWRIKGEDVTMYEMLAKGAEGSVWRGRINGHETDVAIKRSVRATNRGDDHVWDVPA